MSGEVDYSQQEFVLIGQRMDNGIGVVVLVAEPIHVGVREVIIQGEETVMVSVQVKPGYTKVQSDTFQHAMEMIRHAREG